MPLPKFGTRDPVRPGNAEVGLLLPAVQPRHDGAHGVVVSANDGAVPGGKCQQREHPADSMRETAVGVPAGEPLVSSAGRPCLRPPPRQSLAVGTERFGEACAVAEDRVQVGAGRVPAEKVGPVAGESTDHVELRQLWQVACIDTAVRGVKARADVGDDLHVEGVQGALVGTGEVVGRAGHGVSEGGAP